MGISLNMKLLILALFCVAFAAAAPHLQFEDEPRSSDVTLEDDDFDLDDEPRSADAELEPFEDDDDDDGLDMRDGTEELTDDDENDSDALEPTDRGWWGRQRRRFGRWRTRWNDWKVRRFGRWARNCNPTVSFSGGRRIGIRCTF